MNESSIGIYNILKLNSLTQEKIMFKILKKQCYLLIKRSFDIFGSLVGCLFLIPITIILKICFIMNKDYYPIIYSQKRIGKNGKPFNFYKYRSMIPDAEKVLKELLKDPKYKQEWEQNQKLHNDPRITKIGKIIRKMSIDELPQLINILKGDMSLIGPRPLLEGELISHKGNPSIYESVKPGLTGWWASNGRSNLNYENRLKLEYFYIQNMSLWLDIKCIFKTIYVVIGKKGAK